MSQSLAGGERFEYVWKQSWRTAPEQGELAMRWVLIAWAALLWIGLTLATPALAFNDLGHMVVAKVAYDRLEPAQREAIHVILKQHPHYQEFLVANRPAEVSEQEWSFLRAAIWADWVRNNHSTDYNHGPWHYIDYPYTAKAPQSALAVLPDPLPQERNILTEIPRSLEIAKTPGATDADKPADITDEQNRAVRLCWVFHLVGDIHQPCHVTALVDATRFHDPPHDDHGGNLEAILVQGNKPMKLHAYWDTRLGADSDYANVAKIAAAMMENPPILAFDLAAEVGETDLNRWALKQYQLAAKYVYLNGNLPIALWRDAYNMSGTTADADVPRLTAEDQADARRVTRERVWVAGHRLAKMLREVTQ